MIEVIIEVDRKPISTFGCDGVVIGTPTGSTAYAFSGGGPVVWPEVEAILLVPLSAHALFARPLVASPSSMVAVEMMAHGASGVLWCDGRRMNDLLPGSRIEVRKSENQCFWHVSTPPRSLNGWFVSLLCLFEDGEAQPLRKSVRRVMPVKKTAHKSLIDLYLVLTRKPNVWGAPTGSRSVQ